MKKSINSYEFCEEFKACNRDNNFSYNGKQALFDYFEQYEEDTGEEIELDVIAICCDFTEYANIKEFIAEYGSNYSPDKPEMPEREEDQTEEEYKELIEEYEEELETWEDEVREITLEKLQDYTTVIDVDGEAFIIQAF